MGERQAVRRDRCKELGDSVNFFKWEDHDKLFIDKIKDMEFDHLGGRDQERALELLEELHGSH